MDTLSLLLSRFAVSAGVFYTGRICGVHAFPDDTERGHLHLIERGPVDLIDAQGDTRRIDAPTILFLPRPKRHRLVADDAAGAQVLCATVQFGGSSNRNPVSDSLPELLAVELDKLEGAPHLLSMVTGEAFGGEPGAQTAVDCLCELLIIRLLRYCLKTGLTTGGTLAGLSDARLAKALAAIHRDPPRADARLGAGGYGGGSRNVAGTLCRAFPRGHRVDAGALPGHLAHRPGATHAQERAADEAGVPGGGLRQQQCIHAGLHPASGTGAHAMVAQDRGSGGGRRTREQWLGAGIRDPGPTLQR